MSVHQRLLAVPLEIQKLAHASQTFTVSSTDDVLVQANVVAVYQMTLR